MNDTGAALIYSIKRNPVVIYGVILSLLTAVYEAGVADGFTPATLVPVVLSFLARHFTVPKNEVIDLDELVVNDVYVHEDEDGSTGPLI